MGLLAGSVLTDYQIHLGNKLIAVVAVNVRRRGRAPGQAGSSRRRPGCSLAASTGTSPDGDLQTSHAAPSRRSAPGDVDILHHAE